MPVPMLFQIDDYREPDADPAGVRHADVSKMLAELRAERDRLDEAILALTRLASGPRAKRLGRLPK